MVGATSNDIPKYKDLQIKIIKCKNLEKKIVPDIIGALESKCDSLTTHLAATFDHTSALVVQKTSLFGTTHILQNF